MRFEVFSLYEKYYKKVTYFIVLVVTAGVNYYYIGLAEQADTFIPGILYATFLFVVGLYLSNQGQRIDGRIYERKEYYIALTKLRNLLKDISESINTDNDMRLKIITLQTFTSRAEGMKQSGIEPYINECGFRFEESLQSLEEKYLNMSGNLQSNITQAINDYIKNFNIIKDPHFFHEMSLFHTNYDEWCDIEVTDPVQAEELKEFIYKTIDGNMTEINELDTVRNGLIRRYSKYLSTINKNIKRLENTYGNRLQYFINSDFMQECSIKDILNKLEKIQSNQIDYTELNTLKDQVSTNSRDLQSLYERLGEIELNIIDSIQDTLTY